PNQRLKPITLVRLPENPQDHDLGENPLLTRVPGVFCTTKHLMVIDTEPASAEAKTKELILEV
ncbi:MAG: hypothetical protein ACFCVD_25580, partial [Nodosilinea sp.]